MDVTMIGRRWGNNSPASPRLIGSYTAVNISSITSCTWLFTENKVRQHACDHHTIDSFLFAALADRSLACRLRHLGMQTPVCMLQAQPQRMIDVSLSLL